MARKITDDVVIGLRDQLAAKCRATITKMERSTQTELSDFSAERDRLRDRLMDIKAGRDVLVYRHEILAEIQPPRTDGQHVYTLKGDMLTPVEYERVVPSWG